MGVEVYDVASPEERRAQELEADLSSHDQRMARVIAETLRAEWREAYGVADPGEHRMHHDRIRLCLEWQKKASVVVLDAMIKPAVALIVVSGLGWLGWAILQGIRGGA